ncbi:MAG: hypothetical protein WBG95_03295 [Sulfitobacter sp.]
MLNSKCVLILRRLFPFLPVSSIASQGVKKGEFYLLQLNSISNNNRFPSFDKIFHISILIFLVVGLAACKKEVVHVKFERELATELEEIVFTSSETTTVNVNIAQCEVVVKRNYNKECSLWGDTGRAIPNSNTISLSMKDIKNIEFIPGRSVFDFKYKANVIAKNKVVRNSLQNGVRGNPKDIDAKNGSTLSLYNNSYNAAKYLFSEGVNSFDMVQNCLGYGSFQTGSYGQFISVKTPSPKSSKSIENRLIRYHQFCNEN